MPGQHAAAPLEQLVERAAQRLRLLLARRHAASTVTSRRSAAGGGRSGHDAGAASSGSWRSILPLQLLQLRRRVEPELVGEREPRRAVGLERLRLPAAAVERHHQLAAQPLPQRMRGHERLQLRDQLRVMAERELRVEPLLDRAHAQRLQPSASRRANGSSRDRPAPAPARAPAPRSSAARSRRLHATRFAEQLLEPAHVDRLRRERSR